MDLNILISEATLNSVFDLRILRNIIIFIKNLTDVLDIFHHFRA